MAEEVNDVTQEKIVVGKTYDSYYDLKADIAEFEIESRVQFYIRSSRGLDAMRRRAPKKDFRDELLYAELDYACIHGGRKYRSRSTGQRQIRVKSYRLLECPYIIKVRTTADGQKLVVKEILGEHSHELTGPVRSEAKAAVRNAAAAQKRKATPNQPQRLEMALGSAQRLATAASHLPPQEFRQAMRVMEDIGRAWEAGKKVMVKVTDPEQVKVVDKVEVTAADNQKVLYMSY